VNQSSASLLMFTLWQHPLTTSRKPDFLSGFSKYMGMPRNKYEEIMALFAFIEASHKKDVLSTASPSSQR